VGKNENPTLPELQRLPKLLFTYRETAHMLSISEPQVRRLVKDKELVAVPVGKRGKRITAESIRAYIDRRTFYSGSTSNSTSNSAPDPTSDSTLSAPTKKKAKTEQCEHERATRVGD
jgi:excisionase family DNA binding protein